MMKPLWTDRGQLEKSPKMIRFTIANAIWEELEKENECTPFKLAMALIPYAKGMGNNGFLEWVNNVFSVAEAEVISAFVENS